MKAEQVRNWLGIYFLVTTVIFGTYIILFGESRLLPLKRSDAMDAFQIIVPVLVAQITTVYTWFMSDTANLKTDIAPIPSWVIKAPLLLVVLMMILTISAVVVSGNVGNLNNWIDASTFKLMVTFCVTILNATAVLIVVRYFTRSSGATANNEETTNANVDPK